MSFSRQGAEEDWELRPPQGRPEVSSYLAHTPALSFRTLSQESRRQAKPLLFLGCSGGKVGAEDRWGREESQEASWPWQSGRAVLHAAHVGPISHAGLARPRSW